MFYAITNATPDTKNTKKTPLRNGQKSVERYSLVMQWYKTPSGGKGSSKNIDG